MEIIMIELTESERYESSMLISIVNDFSERDFGFILKRRVDPIARVLHFRIKFLQNKRYGIINPAVC